MRRVMADMVASADMIIHPSAVHAQKNIRIPTSDDSNSGPTGLLGVGEHIRQDHELTLEIIDSGDYSVMKLDEGARFGAKPSYLLNEDGDELMANYTNMGKSGVEVIGLIQVLTDPEGTTELGPPRMAVLKKWGRLTSTTGARGILLCPYISAGVAGCYVYRLTEYDDLSGQSDSEHSASWVALSGFTVVSSGAGVCPRIGVVELDDGAILAAAAVDGDLLYFKSYDGGDNWVNILTESGSAIGYVGDGTTNDNGLVLERIGNRVVLLESNETALVRSGRTKYSDDSGHSWSSTTTVYNIAGATGSVHDDLYYGTDGLLYAVLNSNDALSSKVSADGANWSTSFGTIQGNAASGPGTVFQTHLDSWGLFYIEDAGGQDEMYGVHNDGETDPYSFAVGTVVMPGTATAAENNTHTNVSARAMMNGAFYDCAILSSDSDGTTYCLSVVRCAMWGTFQFGDGTFTYVWVPNVFPSAADPDPDVGIWSQGNGGDGAAAFGNEWDHYHLEISASASAPNEHYYYLAGTDLYNEGVMVKCEHRGNTGSSAVWIRMADAASTMEVSVYVIFNSSGIYIYDAHAGSVAAQYLTSGLEWDTQDWNTYWIFAKGQTIKVYRAPAQWYRDFECFEILTSLTVTNLDNSTNPVGDTSTVGWGKPLIGWATADGADGDGYWRSVMVETTLDEMAIDYDPDTDVNGGRCHWNPLGIASGLGAKWAGSFALDGDSWELKTGAAYAPDNIFAASPRRRWQEPQLAADTASATHSIEFRRDDEDGDCMNFVFDSFALFGINTPKFKLIGKQYDGSSSVTLFNNSATYAGPYLFQTVFTVDTSYPDQDVVKFTASTPANFSPAPWDDMLASNAYRNFYVMFISGTKSNRIYRILHNTADKLMLEKNVEDEGVAATDQFVIFSDRFYHRFSSTYTYPRIELQIYGNNAIRPSPSHLAAYVGTLVLGRTYDINDDDWDCEITTESRVQMIESLSGIRQMSEVGPERRMINLAYRIRADRGMGNDEVMALYRAARWGIHPVVWVDDSTFADTNANYSHPDPILARVRGPVSQSRATYARVQHDGVWQNRNAWNVKGVTLEEVI